MNGHIDQNGWNASSGQNAQSAQKNRSGRNVLSDQNALEEIRIGVPIVVWSGCGVETISTPFCCILK